MPVVVTKRLLGLALAVALGGWAVSATAEIDTALRLRLEAIESRLPEPGELERLEDAISRLAGQDVDAPEGDATGVPAANGGAMFSLLQDVQRLQEQVRKLRGAVDELRYQAKQREERIQALYQDLDARLRALEQGGAAGGFQQGGAYGGAGAGYGAGVGGGVDSGGTPGGSGGFGGGAAAGNEAAAESAYLAAFDKLKRGDYAGAAADFEAFVARFPNSSYTDNAWYWLGEARYVDRKYAGARAAFERVLRQFPDSGKAPGAAYKIGVVLDEQGKTAEARVQLQQVIQQYPDDDVAALARDRLQAIGGN